MSFSLLKKTDPATHMAVILMPERYHLWLQNLYTISLELENVHSHVHEPMAAMLRMQWWRDQIKQFNSNATPVDHPCLKMLAGEDQPDLSPLLSVIEAHEEVIEHPLQEDEPFFQFLIRTQTPFLRIICNHLNLCPTDEFLQHYSLAIGILKKIATLPKQLATSRFLLPMHYINAIYLDKSSLRAQKLGSFGRSYTEFLVKRASSALMQTENTVRTMPAQSLLFKVELDVAKTYHRALVAANYDPVFSHVTYDRAVKHPIELLKITAKAWWWSRIHTA